MSKSVNKNKKRTAFTRRNIIIGVIILIIAAPFAIYGYNKWLDARDHERFLAVKSDVEEIEKRLKESISEVEWTLEPTCRRAHLTFGDGDAGCEVRVSSQFNINDSEKARMVASALDSTLSSSSDILTKRSSSGSDSFTATLSDGMSGEGFTHTKTRMRCSSLKEIKTMGAGKVMYVSFECGDDSRDTWFPRSDK